MKQHLPLLLLSLIAAAPSTKPADRFEPYTERIPRTTVKFEMLPVPAGRIQFSIDAKTLPKEIQIRRFWIAKTESTWDEYDVWAHRLDLSNEERTEFFKTHPSKLHPRRPYDFPAGFGHSGYPVIKVTSEAAKIYCDWLSKVTGRKYRLPSEAEWEYACRAGATAPQPDAKVMLEMAWCKDNSKNAGADDDETTQPVGKKKPNAFGIHDMLGNVGEWCTTTDGKFVLRGGWYSIKAIELHCGLRAPFDSEWQLKDPNDPKSKWWLSDAPFAGFRVVREE